MAEIGRVPPAAAGSDEGLLSDHIPRRTGRWRPLMRPHSSLRDANWEHPPPGDEQADEWIMEALKKVLNISGFYSLAKILYCRWIRWGLVNGCRATGSDLSADGPQPGD